MNRIVFAVPIWLLPLYLIVLLGMVVVGAFILAGLAVIWLITATLYWAFARDTRLFREPWENLKRSMK